MDPMLSFLTTLLLFAVVIGFVVQIHELGHFIAARLVGMDVEELAFGMGPVLWKKKVHRTEYAIRLFPIGGFVRILGEEDGVKSKRSFSQKSVRARMFVASAGMVINFIAASLLFYIVLAPKDFSYVGIPYYEDFQVIFGRQTLEYAYPVTVLDVVEGSPADAAGLEGPFEILQVNGNSIENLEHLRDQVEPHVSGTVELTIREEGGEELQKSVGVGEDGKMGFSLAQDVKIWKLSYPGVSRIASGFLHSVNMTEANVFFLVKIVGQAFREHSIEPVSSSIVGPVGLASIVDIVKKYGGVMEIIDLIALLNLGLLIINILPIPALDGGHLFFLTIEAVRGKPANQKWQQIIFAGGMIMIYIVSLLIAVKDFRQFGLWQWVQDTWGRVF